MPIPTLPENEHLFSRFVLPGVFNPAECQQILALKGSETPSGVHGFEHAQEYLHNKLRNSTTCPVPANPQTEWIFQRLERLFTEFNQRYFHFDLAYLWGTQVVRYRPGEFYDWHVDLLGKGFVSTRKLTCVVFLSAPEDYRGGELEWSPHFPPLVQTQGSAVIFPAFIPHIVHPVSEGIRYTLVSWAHGPAFR